MTVYQTPATTAQHLTEQLTSLWFYYNIYLSSNFPLLGHLGLPIPFLGKMMTGFLENHIRRAAEGCQRCVIISPVIIRLGNSRTNRVRLDARRRAHRTAFMFPPSIKAPRKDAFRVSQETHCPGHNTSNLESVSPSQLPVVVRFHQTPKRGTTCGLEETVGFSACTGCCTDAPVPTRQFHNIQPRIPNFTFYV